MGCRWIGGDVAYRLLQDKAPTGRIGGLMAQGSHSIRYHRYQLRPEEVQAASIVGGERFPVTDEAWKYTPQFRFLGGQLD